MQAVLIENGSNGKLAYDSLLTSNPKTLRSLSSKLAFDIIKELSRKPSSAIDIARKLKINEQKIYYRMRRLEEGGIIYPISSERRHGMIAKIYSVVSPVVATKLFERGTKVKESITPMVFPEVIEFFSPFITDGKWNAKIIVGSTKPHGKYEARSIDSPYLIDLLVFLGSLVNIFDSSDTIYQFDTDTTEDDLKNNIILVGNPKTNSVTDKINSSLPIYFDVNRDFRIISKITDSKYSFDHDAVVIKTINPFDNDKKLLLLAGKRSEGLRSAVLALIRYNKEILSGNVKDKSLIAKVVSGVDKNSDGIIDGVKFYE